MKFTDFAHFLQKKKFGVIGGKWHNFFISKDKNKRFFFCKIIMDFLSVFCSVNFVIHVQVCQNAINI